MIMLNNVFWLGLFLRHLLSTFNMLGVNSRASFCLHERAVEHIVLQKSL